MNAFAKTGIALALVAAVGVAASSAVLYSHAATAAPVSAADRAMTSETRAITGAVTAIESEGAIDVTIRQGAVPSLTVRAEKRLLGDIVTTQTGGTLRIETRSRFMSRRQAMQVEIVVPQLSRLAMNGSGNSRVSGFSGNDIEIGNNGSGDMNFAGQYRNVRVTVNGSGDLMLDTGAGESLDLRLNGSGDVRATGKTASLRGELHGSGDIDARGLVADSATVRSAGSGDVELNVRSKVELNLNGSGDVHVVGQPTARAVARNGSGEVSWN